MVGEHQIRIQVTADHIDVLGHANNCEYLRWFEQVAWSHCHALGMSWEAWQSLGYAWVARHTEIEYLLPAFEHDNLILSTWIAENDRRISMTRGYRINRERDNKTLITGKTRWICINLESGKAARMPKAFSDAFASPNASEPHITQA